MKVMFIMPLICKHPTGGYKVVFEYANRLVRDGHDVSIVYAIIHPEKVMRPTTEGFDISWKAIAHGLMKMSVRDILRVIKWSIPAAFDYTSRNWFDLDPRIKERKVFTLNYTKSLDADIYIATGCTTAQYVKDYPADKKKIYFIQEYEDWVMNDEDLEKTYSFPLEKVVISKWLHEKLMNKGYNSTIVPNGFDPKEFYITVPVAKKDRRKLSVMYHTRPAKDFDTSYEALQIVHKKFPDVTVEMFGAMALQKEFPSWIHYHYSPSNSEHLTINNKSSIYIASSYSEGWGLTIGEAMMCGQAVVCTAANGYLEMAVNGRNALVSPVKDANALALNIIKLLEDDDLRLKIANNGVEDIKHFEIENSYKKFKKIIEA